MPRSTQLKKTKRAETRQLRRRFWWKRHKILFLSSMALVFILSLGVLSYFYALLPHVWERIVSTGQRYGLAVHSIFIQGRQHTPREQILKALDFTQGYPLLKVDLGKIQARLENLPWVENAIVQRQFPDVIKIQLFEEHPIAYWQHNKLLHIITKNGKIFIDKNYKNSLPMFLGEGAADHIQELLDILQQYPAVQSRVLSAIRVAKRRWNLLLRGGTTVRLPEENMKRALDKLLIVLNKTKNKKVKFKNIDLRLNDRYIIS